MAERSGTRSARLLPSTDAALEEREERFRNAFVQASLPQALADLDGRLIAMNPLFSDLLGYSPADLLTQTVADLTHPEDREANHRHMERLSAGETGEFVLEKRYLRQDGSAVPVRVHGRLVHDDAGAPRYLHAIALDLTLQHQAESALVLSEARLNALLEHSEDVVLLVSSAGVVTYASPNVSRVAPRLAAPGATIFDALQPVDAARVRAAISEVVLRGGERRLVVAEELWGNSRRYWDVRMQNGLHDPALDGVIATLRDVTDRVRADALAEGESVVLRMLLAGTPRREALDALTRVIESAWPDVRAGVLLCDPDGATLRHGAAPSMPAEFIGAIDGMPVAEGSGVCGTAAFRKAAVVVEDVRGDPLVRDFAGLLRGIGVRSCWSLPLFDGDGAVVGTFAVYGQVPASPTADQWRLAQRLAHLASLIISRHVDAGLARPGRSEREQSLPTGLEKLTGRERMVLRLIALGYTNREVALQLHVGVRTVESHRASVTAKLGAVTRADLVRAAVKGGLLSD